MQAIDQVLEKLKREDDDSYVYRGQLKEYPGPLVPAAHRPLVRQLRHYDNEPLPMTLRRVNGVRLVERVLTGSSADRETALDYQRRQVRTHMRGFFGFAFTEVLSQQAGLCSESLDVTTDPEIAAFFASHQWNLGQNKQANYSPYIPPTSSENVGIIYRWKIERPQLSITALKSWLYTLCPPVLDSYGILKLFEKCNTVIESIDSMLRYRSSFVNEMGIMAADRGNRPLELLRLPYLVQTTSRIVKQKAMLLVPDALENRSFWETQYPDFPRPAFGFWDGMPLIEDFSKSRNVETFYFSHERDQANCLQISAKDIDCKQDVELALTSGWVNASMKSSFGTVPIEMSGTEVDLSSFDIFSGDTEHIERKLQSGETAGHTANTSIEVDALSQNINILSPQELTEDHAKDVLEMVEKCKKHYTWDSGVKLLQCFRSKLSPSMQLDKYLWSSDQLCRMLQKNGRYPEAHAVSDEIFKVCENEYALFPSSETQQRLLVAYQLLFNLLGNAELIDDLIIAYQQFIDRFSANPHVNNTLYMAHIRHGLAAELDEAYRFKDSLKQYNEVISMVRTKSKSDEEVSSLITTASFSKANCLEKLGDLQKAEQEFRALAREFNDSRFPRCRQASQLALGRAAILAQRSPQT